MDIRIILKSKGIMQRFIANQAQINEATLSRYLSGKRKMPDKIQDKIIKILKDMGIFFE